jgi:hypothetical protein
MGVSGSGSLEHGDSSGYIFWLHNQTFLKYYYQMYPEMLPTPPGAPQDSTSGTAVVNHKPSPTRRRMRSDATAEASVD